jgi:inhibitor of cysteine peptidase
MDTRKWYRAGIGAALLLLTVALVAVATAGCDSDANASGGPLKLGDADNGKSYTVKVGDTIEVAIAGNMTTGYSWTAALGDKDAALLQQVGEPVYVEDSTGESLVGAGGTFTFTFKALAKGEATLTLAYSRPWESTPPIQTFAVTVTIK